VSEQHLVWLRSSGGYGYIEPVPCVVVSTNDGTGKAKIAVLKPDEETVVFRNVKASNLTDARGDRSIQLCKKIAQRLEQMLEKAECGGREKK
jgi:hypothetical protein